MNTQSIPNSTFAKLALMLFVSCLYHYSSIAQNDSGKRQQVKVNGDKFIQYEQSLEKKYVEKDFPMHGRYDDVYDKTIDFDHLEHNVFAFMGFYGCHPCEHELPVFIELSEENPDIVFIYITYNDKETIDEELKTVLKIEFQPGKNFYIIHLDQATIRELKLAPMGYPEKYYISRHGVVKYLDSGGLNVSQEQIKDTMKVRLYAID